MSHIDRSVTNQQVIPVLRSTVFDADPTARLACGVLAINGVPRAGLEVEYRAHFDLRRRVYVDQTGQLDVSDLQEDGTDRDNDDARSITFAVFENHPDGVRVIGVARLIVRGNSAPLPVEEFCPDSFEPGDVTAQSVEVSRVIARHETAVLQDVVQLHLFALMLAYISEHRFDRTFAIIEPWLERHLKGVLEIRRIGEPTYVEHYLDYNLPIEVAIQDSINKVDARHTGYVDGYRRAEPEMSFFGRASKGTNHTRAA